MSELASCRACGSDKTIPRFSNARLPLYRCFQCGAVFRAQEVDLKELALQYNEQYYLKTWPGSLGRFFEPFDPARHHKTRFFQKQLAEFEKMAGGLGRLLDVGCANGVFVWLARERGWKAEGVELSPFAAHWGRRQFGVTIHEGTVLDIDPSPPFDVITLWDTIEHLPNPREVLHACFHRLKPGGLFVILTPDAGSLLNQLIHAAHWVAPGRVSPFLHQIYHHDHLTYFDRHSLCLALLAQGFSINWIESYDEDPRDTETRGMVRAGVYAVHLAAAVLQRKHEILVWATRPQEPAGS